MRGTTVLCLVACVSAVALPVVKKAVREDGLVQQQKDVDLSFTQPAHLLKFADDNTKWVTKHEFNELLESDAHFQDITDYEEDHTVIRTANVEVVSIKYPATPALGTKVRPLLAKLSEDQMKENLQTFTTFHNRYYTSKYGKQSSDWLLSKAKETLTNAGVKNFEVIRFDHTDPNNHKSSTTSGRRLDRSEWTQASVIARIPGRSNKTVIIGAHQDSINQTPKSAEDQAKPIEERRAPGADDDGSGSITILEAMRVVLQDEDVKNNNAPNTLEFHWYSAEEAGLLGSQDVFWKYSSEGRDVRAMLQQDMTGYSKGTTDHGKPAVFGVLALNPKADRVNIPLTNFIKSIIKSYTEIEAVDTSCDYACSDHASAATYGYPSAFVIESEMKDTSNFIHAETDTIDTIDFDHMLQHAKLTVGLAYELTFADLPKAAFVEGKQ